MDRESLLARHRAQDEARINQAKSEAEKKVRDEIAKERHQREADLKALEAEEQRNKIRATKSFKVAKKEMDAFLQKAKEAHQTMVKANKEITELYALGHKIYHLLPMHDGTLYTDSPLGEKEIRRALRLWLANLMNKDIWAGNSPTVSDISMILSFEEEMKLIPKWAFRKEKEWEELQKGQKVGPEEIM